MTLVLAQGSLLSPFLPLNKVAKISSQGGDRTLDLLEWGGEGEAGGGEERWRGEVWAGSSPPKEKLREGGGSMDLVKNRPV